MNGYCQIELGGQPRGLKFNLHAIQMLESLFPKGEKIDTIAFITQLIYVGLCGNRYVKTMGAEPMCEETFEQVSDWIDEMVVKKDLSFIQAVNDAFASSKAIPVDEKKNQETPRINRREAMKKKQGGVKH